MHPTATKCIQWAAILFVVGAVLVVVGPSVFVWVAELAGANAAAGVGFIDVALTLVRWTTIPTGASLIGAAIVINTLSPERPRAEENRDGDT